MSWHSLIKQLTSIFLMQVSRTMVHIAVLDIRKLVALFLPTQSKSKSKVRHYFVKWVGQKETPWGHRDRTGGKGWTGIPLNYRPHACKNQSKYSSALDWRKLGINDIPFFACFWMCCCLKSVFLQSTSSLIALGLLWFFSLESFTRPVLRVSSFQPISGSPVTLTCETRLSLERSDVPLQFCFFRNDQMLGSGWSLSPKFQITAMWSKDSGSYWCKAATTRYNTTSNSWRSWIQVQSKCWWNLRFAAERAGKVGQSCISAWVTSLCRKNSYLWEWELCKQRDLYSYGHLRRV